MVPSIDGYAQAESVGKKDSLLAEAAVRRPVLSGGYAVGAFEIPDEMT